MKRFFTIFLACCISAASLTAQQLPQDEALRIGKLDNGLTYYIRHNDRPKGRAEFYLATDAGAILEDKSQDGLAHFLEHMCFNGTKNFPGKGILNYLQSIGASFGQNVNASTGVEQTVYMLNNIPLPRKTVADTCLLILHDYSAFVTNDAEEIDKERGVILEERRTRMNAAWRMYEKSMPYYFGNTPYATCTVIGSEENLKTFRPETLRDFYHTWYRPDLQAVIVVGDIEVDYIEETIKRVFADIPKVENPREKPVIEVPENKDPLIGIITDREATASTIEASWKRPARPKEENSTLNAFVQDVTEALIGSIMEERLGDLCDRKDSPMMSASFGISDLCNTTEAISAGAAAKEGRTLEALRECLREVARMKAQGFTSDEISRAKANMLKAYESSANKAATRKNSEFIGKILGHFFKGNPATDPVTMHRMVAALLPQITDDALNGYARTLIPDGNMVVIYKGAEKEGALHPSDGDILKVIDEVRALKFGDSLQEAVAKDFINASSLRPGKIKKSYKGLYNSTVWMLSNGLKVILYPTAEEKDKVTFDLFKNGGRTLIATEDLPSFEDNVWALYVQNSGVGEFSSGTAVKMLAGRNAGAAPYIGALRHGISATSGKDDVETALQLVHLLFTSPRFDETEWEKGINTLRQVLPGYMTLPNYRFMTEHDKLLFESNPRNLVISMDMLEKASLSTLERVYRQLFNDVAGATLIISGEFNPADIRPLVLRYAGSLPKGRKASAWQDNTPEIVPGTRTADFCVKMETPKATIADVYSAPMEYSSLKAMALNAGQYILDMRYVTSLREEEGGTYGASTDMSLAREPRGKAVISIMYDCNPEMADKLRLIAAKDLKDLAENGPTEEEFSMAVSNMRKKLPEMRLRNSWWTGALKNFELYGEDTDAEYEKTLGMLSRETVRKAVAEVLGSGNFLEVVMRPETTRHE